MAEVPANEDPTIVDDGEGAANQVDRPDAEGDQTVPPEDNTFGTEDGEGG